MIHVPLDLKVYPWIERDPILSVSKSKLIKGDVRLDVRLRYNVSAI